MEIDKLIVGPLQTNCYVLSEGSECILIDAGGGQDTIIKHVESKGLSPKGVLATHGHFDHILSVSAITSRFNVPFLACGKDREIIDGFEGFVKKYMGVDPGPSPEPDQLIGNRTTITLGDKSISVVETPGHTPGSCSFLVDNKMFSGDFIFSGTIGRTDFGGSNTEMSASIRWAKKLEKDLEIYPGHGESTTLEKEKNDNPFFRKVS